MKTYTWRQPRRLLLVLTIALLGGQLLGNAAPVALMAGTLAVAASVIVRLGRAHYAWTAAALCATAIGMLQADALLNPRFEPDHIVHAAGHMVEITGQVRDCVRDAGGRTRLTLEVNSVTGDGDPRPACGRVLATIAQAASPWQPGDRAQATVRLRRPRNFGNPGEFDYEAFLARRQIYVTAFAMSDTAWRRDEAPGGLLSLVTAWRTAIRASLSASLVGSPRAITAALIIGDTASLPPPLWERYARTGVAHVLSISGLHISLVATAAYAALRWIMSRSEWLLLCANVPKLTLASSVIPVVVYGVLAGSSAPTLRSIVMVAVLALGTLLSRRRDWLTSLAAAALIISVLWPGAVFEISFQLSFMSVLTIMIGTQPIVAWWRRWEAVRLVRLRPDAWRWRMVRALVLTLGTTVCAAVGTAPLTAYHFNQVSLITLVANPLVIPLLGIVPVSTGLLASVCVPFAPVVATVLFQIGGLFIACADAVVALLAQVPGAAVRTVSPTLFELAVTYALLGAAILLTGRARTIVLLLCATLLIADGGYWYWERFHRARLRVTFLSVGQGDCAVVELPGSSVMVIDGGGLGGSFDVGERIIAPYLWGRKIGRVDTLVLSHAEHDHYGGLTFLARVFRPRALWWNGVPGQGRQLRELWTTLDEHNVPALAIQRGFRTRIDGVDIAALAPDATASGSLNDRSLVLRLRYGPTVLLFTGDIEADGERRLLDSPTNEVSATILKVPHHGSRTSSSALLLGAVQPAIVVISAGFENRFHMPHAAVLERYAAGNVAVWRTDHDGAVVVEVRADGAITVTGTRADLPRRPNGRPSPLHSSTHSPPALAARLTPLRGRD